MIKKNIRFRTKAQTLEELNSRLQSASVLPLIKFEVQDWHRDAESIYGRLQSQSWSKQPVIVRSSALNEDSGNESMAGKYESVLNVEGKGAFFDAVGIVIASYSDAQPTDQIFAQPMLQEVCSCGVMFTMDQSTGGNYYVINYDDETGSTSSVTSGQGERLKTFYYFKGCTLSTGNERLDRLIVTARELEEIFGLSALDVEFAYDSRELYILQVRPLIMHQRAKELPVQGKILDSIYCYIDKSQGQKPHLHGRNAVFGIMPDWNPAEIVGVRPKPLALSLYKNLVTDGTWAYQRDSYGYKDLRSHPLIIDFGGLPYIDVRVSFNSFIPKTIDEGLGEKLVQYYLERLIENPSLHDKVEFEIIFSCYTFDLENRIAILRQFGFSEQECEDISKALSELTNHIVNTQKGLWMVDAHKIDILKERQQIVISSDLDPIFKIYWLLEDCRRYGTLPFAGLARAAFIAVQILNSLVTTNIFSDQELANYMSSLETVSSAMTKDFCGLSRAAFLKKYGHLRPGTYDICSSRYDEAPDLYFDWENADMSEHMNGDFRMSIAQMQQMHGLLQRHGLADNLLALFEFLKGAIEGREYSKFIFSKSLSDALVILTQLGEEYGLSKEDLSYLDIEVLKSLYNSERDVKEELVHSIRRGRERYEQTLGITIPPIICKPQDCMFFHLGDASPNYITLHSAEGKVRFATDQDLEGSILFIPSADPGYDWIFSRKIAGFVTKYGGANSHMAIRSAELSIPAIVGAGEKLYQHLASAKRVEINCGLKKAVVIK